MAKVTATLEAIGRERGITKLNSELLKLYRTGQRLNNLKINFKVNTSNLTNAISLIDKLHTKLSRPGDGTLIGNTTDDVARLERLNAEITKLHAKLRPAGGGSLIGNTADDVARLRSLNTEITRLRTNLGMGGVGGRSFIPNVSGDVAKMEQIKREAVELRSVVQSIGRSTDLSGLTSAASLIRQMKADAIATRQALSQLGRGGALRTRQPPEQARVAQAAAPVAAGIAAGFDARGVGRAMAQGFIGYSLLGGAMRAGRSAGEGILAADDVRALARASSVDPDYLFSEAAKATTKYPGASQALIADAALEQFGSLKTQLDQGAISAEQYSTRITAVTERVAKNTEILSTGLKDAGRGAENARQLEKALAVMGQNLDPATAEKFSQGLIRATIASGFDIDPEEQKRSLQQLKGPLANALSEVGIGRLSLMRDETGRAATASARIFYQELGKYKDPNVGRGKESAQRQIALGLREKTGRSIFTDQDWLDPVQAVIDKVIPILEKRNVNLESQAAVTEALSKGGLTSTQLEFISTVIAQRPQLEIEKERLSAVDPNKLVEQTTLRLDLANVEAKFQDAAASITKNALPAVSAGLEGLAGTLDRLGKGESTATDIAAMGAAAVSAGLASGVIGMLTPETRPIAAAGLSLQAAAVALTGSATALTGAAVAQGAGAAGKGLGVVKSIPLVGAFAAAIGLIAAQQKNPKIQYQPGKSGFADLAMEIRNNNLAINEIAEDRATRVPTVTPAETLTEQQKQGSAWIAKDEEYKRTIMELVKTPKPGEGVAGPVKPSLRIEPGDEGPAMPIPERFGAVFQEGSNNIAMAFGTGATEVATAGTAAGTSISSGMTTGGASAGATIASAMTSAGAQAGNLIAAAVRSAAASINVNVNQSSVDTGGQMAA